jgi:hypothetical protein
MYGKIEDSYTRMQEIDRLGAFEKDDEAGTTFPIIKSNNYRIKRHNSMAKRKKEK